MVKERKKIIASKVISRLYCTYRVHDPLFLVLEMLATLPRRRYIRLGDHHHAKMALGPSSSA